VCLRIGLVLGTEGGLITRMLTPFEFGLGGPLGSGRQWMSWIALEDVIGILRFAIENGEVRGAVNVVSPQPLRNLEFTAALAKALHRRAFCPAPAFLLRLLLGEMADAVLLSSQRALPAQLEKFGYHFLYPNLPAALAAVLS